MSLSIETEREAEAAFRKTYPQYAGLLELDAGIIRSGFRVRTFDPKTRYAQLESRPYRPDRVEYSDRRRVEYYEFVPVSGFGIVTRERCYSADLGQTQLERAGIGYKLKEGFSVRWSFKRSFLYGSQSGSQDIVPFFLPTLEIRQPAKNGAVCVGKCLYFNQAQFPTLIIAADVAIHVNYFRRDYSVIRKDESSSICPSLGYAGLGNEFTHPCLPGSVEVRITDRFMRIIRRRPQHPTLKLVAPRLDLGDVNARIRGPQQSLVRLPQDYPVDIFTS